MKRTIFLAASMLMALVVSAQVDTNSAKVIDYSKSSVIPSCFSFDGKAKIVCINYPINDKYYIYDEDFNETVLEKKGGWFSYLDYDFPHSSSTIEITQTLFNDDEEYEFIEFIGTAGNYTGFKIITPTKTIQEIYFGDDLIVGSTFFNAFKFCDKYYLSFSLLNSYSKLIYRISKNKSSGIVEMKKVNKPLADIIQNSRVYAADGRRLQSTNAGLNIIKTNDGSVRKVMLK